MVARLYGIAWLPYLAMYVLVFRMMGLPWGAVVPGALANVLPEAALGVVPLRRGWRAGIAATGSWRPHLVLAPVFALAAAAAKLFLFGTVAGLEKHGWAYRPLEIARTALLDFVLVVNRVATGAPRGPGYDPAVLAWQVLLALLVYAVLAAVGHAAGSRERLRAEEARAARAEALVTQAELQALRAQLNPHFLFNTLHSLLALIRHDPGRAELALEQFGDLMRYALRVHHDGMDEVRLRQEWEFITTYLELERLRLGDRLRVTLRAEPDVLDEPVPAFCLQPLVENAVRHAVSPRASGATVEVRAGRRDGVLSLEVVDDGNGAAAPDRGPGLGLRLVRERLHSLHGDRARLDIETAPGAGFRVALRIPAGGARTEEG